MDEIEVQRIARDFVRSVGPAALPVSLEPYLAKVGATLKVDMQLSPEESGWSAVARGKLHINVNGNDSPERRRFTICHELGHSVLNVPSQHEGLAPWSYLRRPPNEILCDVFAAELLLPVHLFKPLVDSAEPGFTFIEDIGQRAEASLLATSSRFAALAPIPCAFVVSENDKIKYSVRSASMRAAKAWIQPRTGLPKGSVTERVSAGERCDKPEEVDPDIWFTDWSSGGAIFEEARYSAVRRQALTLLWGNEEEIKQSKPLNTDESEAQLEYRELDGVLPWPGKRKRR